MHKLLILSLSVLFSVGLYAQQATLSGSDGKIKYNVKVEKLADKVNDRFFEFYAFEATNTSNSDVTFTPVFNYTNEVGVDRTSTTRDDEGAITLKAGQSIKGNVTDKVNLTLFKQYLVGNSGKKSSDYKYTLNSVTINY